MGAREINGATCWVLQLPDVPLNFPIQCITLPKHLCNMYDLAFFYFFLMAGYLDKPCIITNVCIFLNLYQCLLHFFFFQLPCFRFHSNSTNFSSETWRFMPFRYLYILARFIKMKAITLTQSLELCEWEIANQAFLGSQMSRDTSR